MESKPLPQLRPSPPLPRAPDRDRQRLALPDENDEALAARHPRVNQVPLKHRVMLGDEGDHDGRVLRPLALVDRRLIGQHQLIEPARADVTLRC
jgi:hypothetical protein